MKNPGPDTAAVMSSCGDLDTFAFDYVKYMVFDHQPSLIFVSNLCHKTLLISKFRYDVEIAGNKWTFILT